MEERVEVRMESLKLLKEASNSLMTVQSAALAVIGALIEKTAPQGVRWCVAVGLLASLVISVFFGGIAILGTIPYVAQRPPTNPESSIYDERGGLPGMRSPSLGTLWKLQYRLFVVSLVLFAIFATWRS